MLGMEWLCRYFGMSNGFIAVALVLVPVIVTGGIHVDGLLDTSDALSSWRDREKRLEILKDSHAGAFAVITAIPISRNGKSVTAPLPSPRHISP